MAIQHNVSGCALVNFNAVDLGYSVDGVSIRFDPMWAPLKSDCYGGAQGVPSDAQFFGAVGTVSAELTKYERSAVEKLTSFTHDVALAEGTLPVLGTLARAGSLAKALIVTTDTEIYTFSTALLFHGVSVNKGLRSSLFSVAWQVWIDADTTRVLYARTIPV